VLAIVSTATRLSSGRRGELKCDVTRAETRFHLSAKRTIPFKSAGGVSSVYYWHSRGVRIRDRNAGYTVFRGSVKGTGYPLHSPVSPSLPLPCVTVCRHISTGVYCYPIYRVGKSFCHSSDHPDRLWSPPSLLFMGKGTGKAVPLTGMDRPTGFQEVKVPRFRDNGTGSW